MERIKIYGLFEMEFVARIPEHWITAVWGLRRLKSTNVTTNSVACLRKGWQTKRELKNSETSHEEVKCFAEKCWSVALKSTEIKSDFVLSSKTPQLVWEG